MMNLFILGGLICLFAIDSVVGIYDKKSPVTLIDKAEFGKLKKSGDPFLIEYFSPQCGHCVQFVPEFEKTAKVLKGIVKVVATDDKAALQDAGVTGLPTVMFVNGVKPTETYSGERNAKDLVTFVFGKLRSVTDARMGIKKSADASDKKKDASDKKKDASDKKKDGEDVVVLTDSNFEKIVGKEGASEAWFIKFYAPWCGHCKAIAPTWEKLGKSLKGKVKIAKVDATVHKLLAETFEIKGFPTLVLIPPFGDRRLSDLARRAVPHQGARSFDDLMQFSMQYAGSAESAKQLLTQSDFSSDCAKGVCIIAFLPHILDVGAAGRNDSIKIINEVIKASYSAPVKFLWTEGGAQLDFEDKLYLAFGFPAVLAVNLEKSKYSIHKGSFSEEALRTFITGMMAGRVQILPLPEPMPEIKTVEAWDGKDGALPIEEDDEL